MLQCNNYNNAFVHRGFSFESALLDAMMLLNDADAENVLVGAVDEITTVSHIILSRMGLYRREPVSNEHLFSTSAKGTIAGEGAAFFLLANQSSSTDYAKLEALKTFYKPAGINEIENQIISFLAAQQIQASDIDLVITGRNGDLKNDSGYDQLTQSVFKNNCTANYKQLCGEYPTSTAFAVWMAANIIKTRTVPASILPGRDVIQPVKRILIYNNYLQIHHSLVLLSAC